MNEKNARIAALVAHGPRQGWDAHYIGFFDCFNSQRYFEAHEVLEQLWLPQRQGANGGFYKGLIQLAGAFVHLQKKRPGPAKALFKLAQSNLEHYPVVHESLDLAEVLSLIRHWLVHVEQVDGEDIELTPGNRPKLSLLTASSAPD